MSADAQKLALDLEELIPDEHKLTASVGGVIADILAIVAAVKAQDWKAAALAVAQLIQDIAGQTEEQKAAIGGGKINWANVWNIIGKLLPIIGGFVI